MGNRSRNLMAALGPGLLVAATGVGAGDLATGAFSGSKLGLAVLWAVVLGAGFKFVLNEGLARWQLATGSTLLEGCALHLGRTVMWLFLVYLFLWSFFVGSALMSACGATVHAVFPLHSPERDKILYGVLHSLAAVVMVWVGGYRLFEKVMRLAIALMFVVVVTTAVILLPDWHDFLTGLIMPTIPDFHGEGLPWTVGLIGGVGGTVTVLCYGYWIREEGRHGIEELTACRVDLAVGYAMTALFGLAMVVIGSRVEVEGGGAGLIVNLAEELKTAIHPAAKWAFLAGAWGAVFSSLLGVWQSIPYLFANCWNLLACPGCAVAPSRVDSRSIPYRVYLLVLAGVPTAGLWMTFESAQKLYAIVGAMFVPMLAVVLLILNGRSDLVGRKNRNPALVSLLLISTLAFFALVAWLKIQRAFSF